MLAVSWIITAICEGFDDNEYMYDKMASMCKCTAEIMEFPKTYNTLKPVQTEVHNQSLQETERTDLDCTAHGLQPNTADERPHQLPVSYIS